MRVRFLPGVIMSKEEAKRIRYLPSTERLMRQFLKLESGLGNSDKFKESPAWCKCGRLNSTDDEHAATCPDNVPHASTGR